MRDYPPRLTSGGFLTIFRMKALMGCRKKTRKSKKTWKTEWYPESHESLLQSFAFAGAKTNAASRGARRKGGLVELHITLYSGKGHVLVSWCIRNNEGLKKVLNPVTLILVTL